MQFTHASTRFGRAVAVTAAGALAAGGALLALPAGAQSAPLSYTCGTAVGDHVFTVVADTDLPATATAGSPLTGTGTFDVTIPDALRNTMYAGLNARTVEGTAAIQSRAFGTPTTLDAVIPVTEVPTSGDLVLEDVSAPVSLTAPAAPGVHEIHAGDFTTTVVMPGALIPSTTVTCVLDPGQPTLVDTVTVTPAATPAPTPTPTPTAQKTSTKVKAKVRKAARKAVLKVKVRAADGSSGEGTVKIKVKRGKKKVAAMTKKVNAKGVVKLTLKKLRRGRYQVVAAFKGSDLQKRSRARATFRL